MTNYVNFKLSKDVEKNPGPTQYNTDHEVITRPFMQNHSSTMQLVVDKTLTPSPWTTQMDYPKMDYP